MKNKCVAVKVGNPHPFIVENGAAASPRKPRSAYAIVGALSTVTHNAIYVGLLDSTYEVEE